MCKKRTEMFIKLASKYKVETMEDVKDLVVKGFEAVSEDSSESYRELNSKVEHLDQRLDERLSNLEKQMNQVLEYIVKPRGKIVAFFSSKKFLVVVIIALVLIMLSGIGVMGVLDKSSNISEIAKSIKK